MGDRLEAIGQIAFPIAHRLEVSGQWRFGDTRNNDPLRLQNCSTLLAMVWYASAVGVSE